MWWFCLVVNRTSADAALRCPHTRKLSQSCRKKDIKGTSKLLTAECIQNWSETVVVADNCRQDFYSGSLLFLVDTKQFSEEEIHLVRSEQSIVQTEVNLNYTMTETRTEHRSLALASSKQTWDELSVQFELMQESTKEDTTALQHVEHGKFFRMTMFHVGTLFLEE